MNKHLINIVGKLLTLVLVPGTIITGAPYDITVSYLNRQLAVLGKEVRLPLSTPRAYAGASTTVSMKESYYGHTGSGAAAYNFNHWQAPAGTSALTVEAYGAGGGGGGSATNDRGGGGGGGGGYARSSNVSVIPDLSYFMSVGRGGSAGAAAGIAGTASSFSGLVVAAGGAGGAVGGTNTGGAGGTSNTGDVTFNGGNGSDAVNGSHAGAGGGGAGSQAPGDSANLEIGGAGGAVGGGLGANGRLADFDEAAGLPGSTFGGGGGGGYRHSTNQNGGLGAGGFLGFSYQYEADRSFPIIRGISSGRSNATNEPVHSVTLPDGIVTGELLVVIISSDGNPTLTANTGWTKLGQASQSSAVTGGVFWKIAAGGDTFTLTTSASEQISYLAYRIDNHGGTITGTSLTGTNVANAPAHTPPGGLNNYMWLVTRSGDGVSSPTSYSGIPSGYGFWRYSAGTMASNGAVTDAVAKFSTASSEDPGQFLVSGEEFVVWTLAIPVIASGTPMMITYPQEQVSVTDGITLAGSITSLRTSENATSRGFEISPSLDFSTDVTTITENGSFAEGDFNIYVDLSSYDAGVPYYYRAWAESEYGIGYGAAQAFAIPTILEVESLAATMVTSESAGLHGNIVALGNAPTSNELPLEIEPIPGIDHGFIFGTSPTLVGGDTATTSLGSFNATGSFSTTTIGLDPNTTYYYRAYAIDEQGGVQGDIRSFLTVPGVPGTPTFSSTSSALRIEWTAPNGGASSYKVERCQGSGCDDFVQIALGITDLFYDDSGLEPLSSYSYRVRATNATGDGAYSVVATVQTDGGSLTVGTESATNIDSTMAVIHGNILSQELEQSEPALSEWTIRTSAADNSWLSVTYGNGLFVAVASTGTGNRVMTSEDGIEWTIRESAADNSWLSVTYGNGLFVAVANSSTGNRVMTSPDGITWTLRTSAADNQWRSVTYGNGLFVAVASTGTGNRVMTSEDGIEWTIRESAADNSWLSVTYGNGLFVAVANSGTGNRVMTSPDGINWTIQTSAADNSWRSVTYGDGRFVAVAASGTGNRVMTSEDGIEWTIRESAADNFWLSVTYGNGLFVAVAFLGTSNRVMTSPDGITWTSQTSAADNSWYSVTYGNGLFVAVAASGTGNRVMTADLTPGAATSTPGLDHGFVWGTSPTLIGGDTATTSLGTFNSTGPFQSVLSGLQALTTYYYRAYARDANGTVWGEIVSFITRVSRGGGGAIGGDAPLGNGVEGGGGGGGGGEIGPPPDTGLPSGGGGGGGGGEI